MSYLQWAFGIAGAALQLLVVSALARGAYKTFPILFAYVITLFLTTVMDAAAVFGSGDRAEASRNLYWINDAIRQLFIFCLVISLIDRTMGNSPRRPALRRWLVLVLLLLAVLSFYMLKEPFLGLWLTRVSRNLSFCAVILNLILWAALIRYKQPDQRLLLVSGGLGIQMTGEAIGQSLRQLSRSTELAGNLILVLAHLLCLYIWWQAFRSSGEKLDLAAARQQH